MSGYSGGIEKALAAIQECREKDYYWEVDAQSPLPSPLDAAMSDFIDQFCESPADERAELIQSADHHLRDILITYAMRMAVLAVRQNDEKVLLRGLIAVAIENMSRDYRDSLLACSLLRNSARKIAIKPERVFRLAAEYALPQTRKMLRWFHWYPMSNLGSAGYKEARGEGQFAYERIEHSWVERLFPIIEWIFSRKRR